MANAMANKLILLNLSKLKAVFGVELHKFIPTLASQQQIRNSSFRASNPVRDINEYPEVKIEKNPPEWKYVERLLAPKLVPKPIPKTEYPSGWTPPKQFTEETSNYYIARTKNYMIPVYLDTTHRGTRRLTTVRRIQGDIWQLEKDIRKVIETYRNGKVCASRVNELSGQIQFHGDYVNLVKDFLQSKGF